MPTLQPLRRWLGHHLVVLGQRIAPVAPVPAPAMPVLVKAAPPPAGERPPAAAPSPPPLPASRAPFTASLATPANREPLSVEEAVLGRSMALLKREASDSLAALGAAHALVTSARLSQVQQLRDLVERGTVPLEALGALAADYQGWQNDQVRLFDAMALVLRMAVPTGTALEQIDPHLHEQARAHLASLSTEYQRGLLMDQFRESPSTPEA